MSQAATVIDLDSIRRQRRAAKKPAPVAGIPATPVMYPVWVMWMPMPVWPTVRFGGLR
jgi:hypothetical protein